MKCPLDGADLVMTERQGIEIDYCPTCRGVWLDRGELDKIVDRAAPPEPSRERERGPAERSWHDRRDDDRDYKHGHGHKRRKSMLGELFDF